MKKIYQTTMAALAMIILFGTVILCAYGLWQFERYYHYKLSYRSMVQQTVRDMVKAEALKEAR